MLQDSTDISSGLCKDSLSGENSQLKRENVELSPEALVAYKDLKMRCMTSLVLTFVDFNKPFMLETDFSKEGVVIKAAN